MFLIDTAVSYSKSIDAIRNELIGIPDGDIPLWAEESIVGIELEEKECGWEVVRDESSIDHLLTVIAEELSRIDEAGDLIYSKNPEKRIERIRELRTEQNRLMIKAELLRRIQWASRLSPFAVQNARDSRILWLGAKGKIRARDFLEICSERIIIPPYLELDSVVRAHFLEKEFPTTIPPGYPQPLHWVDDTTVLARLFKNLGEKSIVQNKQWQNISIHFLDVNKKALKPESLHVLAGRERNDVNIAVDKICLALCAASSY